MKNEEKGLIEANNNFWSKIKGFFSKIFGVKKLQENNIEIPKENEREEVEESNEKQKLPDFVLEYKQETIVEKQRLMKLKNEFDNYLIDEKDIDAKDRQKLDKMYDMQLREMALEYKAYEKTLENLKE